MKPTELCADIKIYDYKKKQIYHEKSLIILESTGKVLQAGKACEDMAGTLLEGSVYYSPLLLGKVEDYLLAEKMMKELLHQYLGKPSALNGYGEGLLFVHEDLNCVERKAYEDMMHQAGNLKSLLYMDENVQGKPDGFPWEDVIWGMINSNKKLRFAVEITKDNPEDYLRYAVEELSRKCKKWGIDRSISIN